MSDHWRKSIYSIYCIWHKYTVYKNIIRKEPCGRMHPYIYTEGLCKELGPLSICLYVWRRRRQTAVERERES
jgi:hypothetical protein